MALPKVNDVQRARPAFASKQETPVKFSSATFGDRRAALLRLSVSDLVVRPGGMVHVPTAAEHGAATQKVTEQMLDEIHSMLRRLVAPR